VDPYYLTHKAQVLGYIPQVILAGRSINDGMGAHVAQQVIKRLIQSGQPVHGSRVTVLGFTFKENVPDLRNTRVIDIVKEFAEYGVQVQVHDPLADPHEAEHEYGLTLTPAQALQPAQAVVLAVAHEDYLNAGWPGICSRLEGGRGVVFDVKGKLPRTQRPAGVSLFRL
jgi:UDP-N-acetyl-D-galactosamine dehydrogenase